MVGRAILFASVGAAAMTLAACEFKTASAGNPTAAPASPVAAMPADIGEPLYQSVSPTPRPQQPKDAILADPIVVRNCQVTLPQTQNVPSKNDGKILAFCTEIAPGEDVPESEKYVHQRTGKIYRKLHESNIVKKDQLIAILDDAVPAAKRDVARAAKVAAEAKKVAAIKLEVVAKAELQVQQDLKQKNATTLSDYRRAEAQWDQSVAGIAEAEGNLQKAVEEDKMSLVELGEYEIRTSIPGMIKRLYRKPGESVKALEPVAEIQNLDMLRVEGLLDYQNLSAISNQRDMEVIVEPSPQFGPLQYLEGHLQPVRSVAVNKDKSRPLIVSSSDDKTVRVWDRKTKEQLKIFVNTVPVRAVACTSATASENLCLTGADDGVPRLYNLDTLAPAWKDGETPKAEFNGRHTGQIVSVAFAPNGKYCATADNRDIILWDVTTGDQKYKFAAHHKAPITYIQFTPQCALVSEARDHSMALWSLGQSGAKVDKSIDDRHNDVDVLGVNADGTRVLFDQERELRVLTTDRKTEGVLPAPSEASQFVGFALFSPDDRLVLAAGTGDNPLQLWKAPQPGVRGYLVRRLALPPGGNALCGAFAPDSTFAVTGTQDSRVLVWEMPGKDETNREIRAKVILRDPTIDTDRKARLWAILAKPEGIDLPAGDTVNIVIPPAERRK